MHLYTQIMSQKRKYKNSTTQDSTQATACPVVCPVKRSKNEPTVCSVKRPRENDEYEVKYKDQDVADAPLFHHTIRPVTQRFTLDESTKAILKARKPQFGFNGLGEVVFRRTYSRDNEDWADVVIRVIQGVLSIRKEHFYRSSLHWDDREWQKFARNMAVSMFDMEWLPPGRGLWMMGTDFVYTRGSMALQNCCATGTKEDLVHAAEWAMDCLMNGVGVGFNTEWRGTAEKPDKTVRERYVIDDSREGWISSLIKLMCAYIRSPKYGKNGFPDFDYSKIRASGLPIKGFGGIASGPEPLKKLHERVEKYLDCFCEGYVQVKNVKKPYNHTRLTVDVFNAIGACVVAGSVRRCLPKGAMVHTKAGLVPIEKISVGTEVLTSDGYEKVSATFDQGEQKLVKIVTQDGDFRCTANHRMAVCTSYDKYEWKTAEKLVEGDRLLSSRAILPGSETSLPEWSYEKPAHSTTCKNITIPELDTYMAWLIGMFHSDGYTYPNYECGGKGAYVSVVVGLNEYDMGERIKQQLERFGENLLVNLHKRKGENSYSVVCSSKQLSWYFAKHLKLPNTPIRVPEFIMNSTVENRLAYLAGVADADGALGNRPIIAVTTVYEEFARDIQKLLYSCGIESRLCIDSDDYPSRVGWQRLYHVTLITKRSQKLFSEIPELMKTMRNSSRSQNANGFPTEFETVSKTKSKFGLYSNRQFNIDAYDRHYGECWYTPIEVKKVIPDTAEHTYDIEVENKHEFFCDGYLTHNSAEISLGDVSDRTFINLKNYGENPERGEIGWMSNNSVVLKSGLDFENFEHIPELAQRIRDNGEPGMINLHNIQKFGRIGKEMPDTATLTNPCVTGDTWITTSTGAKQVKDLLNTPFQALVDGKPHNCETGFFHTGNKETFCLETEDGHKLCATANHRIMTENGWVELGNLKKGDMVRLHNHCNTGKKLHSGIKSVTPNGKQDVYDATVEDVHAFDANGIYAHNCGEIPLSASEGGGGELCNLSETFPPRCAGPNVFYQALKYATFYATTVSLLPTHRPESNAIVAKNRRIGVSISGIAQWASSCVPKGWGNMNYTKLTKYLRNAYRIVKEENKRLANKAGVPESIRVTTVKPSGSISLLAGVTPGVHYPVSRYAIRRMRIGVNSPLIEPLKNAGIPWEKDTYSDNTLVFEFVVDHGDVRPCEEVSPWEQFSLVAMIQRCFSDNSVSATIYFDKEKDGPDVEKLLAMYIPVLKSVSMLPHSGHGYAQAPYEPIDKSTYEKRLAKYGVPNFGEVRGNVPEGSKYCTTDKCEFLPPSK